MQNEKQPSHIDTAAYTTKSWRIDTDTPPMPDASYVSQPDSGHHTASGCVKLKGMYIERHNKIGRIMMKEIARGRKGGLLVQLDLGSQTKLTDRRYCTPTSNHSPGSSPG